MATVSRIDQWFDEYAEELVGLPVAEAVRDVMIAGLHVEVSRPDVHRVRDTPMTGVSVVTDRRGVVVDVQKLDGHLVRSRSR